MVVLFLALLVVAALVIFSVQNAQTVSISFLLWQFSASLAIVVFLSAVTGIVLMAIIDLALKVKRSRAEVRRREKPEARREPAPRPPLKSD